MTAALVGILVGSESDRERMQGALDELEKRGIAYEFDVRSAHRQPDEVAQYCRTARERARPLFDALGLVSFEDARPHELSGGMRQRVAFLRTLLAGKDVLLLDEPFGALDSLTRGQMQDWLRAALAHEPRTVLLVTHDVEEALLVADRIAVLSRRPGHVVAELDVNVARDGSRREVVTQPAFVELRERVLEALE